MSPEVRPAQAYYQACRGRWRARYAIDVTNPAALATSGLGLRDRLGVRLLSAWPNWLGAIAMETSVDWADDRTVVHSTCLRWLGLPLMRSVETFALAEDGVHFEVRGGMTGRGRVDASAAGAHYTLTWRGALVVQHTERLPDQVTVVQLGPGFSGRQILVRQSDG